MCCVIAHIHTRQYQYRAYDEPGSYLFPEHPVGKEDGGYGVEVYPVCGNYGAQFRYYPTPDEESRHRGNDT